MLKVYIVDDDPTFPKVLAANIGSTSQYRVEVFQRPSDLLQRRSEEPPDAVITDLKMPEMSGIELTRQLRKFDPHLPVFILTGHGEIESAVEALKAGATDYLTKPVNMTELQTVLRRALDDRPLREQAVSVEQSRRKAFAPQAILGKHPLVDEVRKFVRRMATVPNATVLLLGESGTGKNLVAAAIHYANPEMTGRFVEINCSAMPDQLLESELFGYQKGAFTDARESKRGLIETADGGTLFLDEIGELPLPLQSKLLGFLESRRFRRLGGTEEISVNVRIITATNRDLNASIKSGEFRADLYYRIGVATHSLPPLRVIKDDIPLLANYFRERFNHEFRKQVKTISADALKALTEWQWPGNVRELRNVMERAMIFADGTALQRQDLPGFDTVAAAAAANGRAPGLSLADAEREHIRQTLEQCQGNVQQAAEILGISRKTLWEKRKKYGLLS